MSQIVLITGASSGIGNELGKICASHQHDLILVARRDNRLQALKQNLEAAYRIKIWTYPGDLTSLETREQLFHWTQSQGLKIYGLVNNAGFGDLAPFIETDWNKQNNMLQLNIVALTHLTRLFLPGMVEQGQGRILNLASTAAFLPGPYMAVYYASKAYVLSFTEAIASELKGTGVTATTLCPGPTESEFQDQADMGSARLVKGKKLPTAEEVARCGYEAMERGQRLAIYGFSNRLLSLTTRLLPRQTLAEIAKSLQAPTLER